jgi:hypothetical protein
MGMNNFVSEKVIEDVLSSDKSILAELLSLNPANLSLVARQKVLKSGKLDLLYLYEDELLLIELKVVEFSKDIIHQINGYSKDLCVLQAEHRLIDTEIRKVVLVTEAQPADSEMCTENSIHLVIYRPEFVLSRFFENFRELSYFLKLRSGDYGVVRLGLIKSTLRLLSQGMSIKDMCAAEARSEKTVKNRLSVAALLGLVAKFKNEHFLTDFGNSVLEASDSTVEDRFNDKQIQLLSDFVRENPFYSSVTYTIFSIIESVFVLSKSRYPVPKTSLEDYFVKSVGKGDTWRAEKARETATYIFSNYACELEFLAKVNNHFYITPKGIQAVLLLQLNRSLKLIESQR